MGWLSAEKNDFESARYLATLIFVKRIYLMKRAKFKVEFSESALMNYLEVHIIIKSFKIYFQSSQFIWIKTKVKSIRIMLLSFNHNTSKNTLAAITARHNRYENIYRFRTALSTRSKFSFTKIDLENFLRPGYYQPYTQNAFRCPTALWLTVEWILIRKKLFNACNQFRKAKIKFLFEV